MQREQKKSKNLQQRLKGDEQQNLLTTDWYYQILFATNKCLNDLHSRKVDKQMTDWKTTSRISVSKFDFQHPNHCRTLHCHILGPPMIELTPARCEDGVARARRRFDVAVLVIVAEPIVAPTHDVGDDDGGTPAAVVTAHIVVSLINASSVMVVVVMMTVRK